VVVLSPNIHHPVIMNLWMCLYLIAIGWLCFAGNFTTLLHRLAYVVASRLSKVIVLLQYSKRGRGSDWYCICVGLLRCNALKMEEVFFPKRLSLPTSTHSVTTQKTNIVVFTAVRISNLDRVIFMALFHQSSGRTEESSRGCDTTGIWTW
jgi:hypothetical protein